MFSGPFDESIIKRAVEKGKIRIFIHNLRDFGIGKHRLVDDRPYGGGPGMVLKPEPIGWALKEIERETTCSESPSPFREPVRVPRKRSRVKKKERRIVFLSPQGKLFTQEKAKSLAKYKTLVLICGHYEGIDERISSLVDEEISIGDYVLTGGEIPVLVLVDSIVRLLPGVVGKRASLRNESFHGRFLDYPQYTRPRVWQRKKVPAVLLSGHQKKILLWRKKQAIRNTYFKRPDLFSEIYLAKEEKKIYEKLRKKYG